MKKRFGIINPITIKTNGDTIEIKRAAKHLTILKQDIRAIAAERRFFRGHVLSITTSADTIYFKQTAGNVRKAMQYLNELVR